MGINENAVDFEENSNRCIDSILCQAVVRARFESVEEAVPLMGNLQFATNERPVRSRHHDLSSVSAFDTGAGVFLSEATLSEGGAETEASFMGT